MSLVYPDPQPDSTGIAEALAVFDLVQVTTGTLANTAAAINSLHGEICQAGNRPRMADEQDSVCLHGSGEKWLKLIHQTWMRSTRY